MEERYFRIRRKTSTMKKENNISQIKQIVVNHGLRKQIMAALGATYPTVRAALHFMSDTEKAQQIRQYAIDHGGILLQSQ